MRITSSCMECLKEFGRPNFEVFNLPYYENRIAIVECSHGHKSALVLQSQKFEVLMESGADALLNGFTLEACATFYAALERTYEFAIRVFMRAKQIDDETFNVMFKEMSRMSERQIGAFMAIYLLETGIVYRVDRKLTEFRNNVIHNGKIPLPEEAVNFCSNIYRNILDIVNALKKDYLESVHQVVLVDMSERQSSLEVGIPRSTTTGTIFFNMSFSIEHKDFNEALENFRVATQILKNS